MAEKIVPIELSYSDIEIIIELLQNDIETNPIDYMDKIDLLNGFKQVLADNSIPYYFRKAQHE